MMKHDQHLSKANTTKFNNKITDMIRSNCKFNLTSILNDVTTKTAFPLFDDYIKQNYLDNILRKC